MIKFHILVSGYGAIAKRHINNLEKLGCIKSLSIIKRTSIDKVFNTDYPVKIYTTFDEVLNEKIDFAIVASPANFHFEQVRKLTNHGVPCFIEKPLTSSPSEASMLVDFLLEKKAYCAIGYDLVETIGFSGLKEKINSGQLGGIWRVDISVGQFLPDWRPEKAYKDTVSAQKKLGGGALRELSHELDYLLALFDILKITFNAQLVNHHHLTMDCENEVNIFGELLLKNQNEEASFAIHLDMLQRQPKRTIQVYGEYGVITWDLIAQKITLQLVGQKCIVLDVCEEGNQPYLQLLKKFIQSYKKTEVSKEIYRAKSVMKWIELVEVAAESGMRQVLNLEKHNE